MVIQYCSDLHLEFRENRNYLTDNPLSVIGDVLLLAGDLVPFAQMDGHKDFFNFLSDNFKTTYWLLGNHEYYHSDIRVRSGNLHEKIRDNVFLVNNTTIENEGVNLIFSTLWSKIGIVNQWEIRNSMADFKLIMDGDRIFDVTAYNALHINSMDFLRTALASKPVGKTVVVSHHVPTF